MVGMFIEVEEREAIVLSSNAVVTHIGNVMLIKRRISHEPGAL